MYFVEEISQETAENNGTKLNMELASDLGKGRTRVSKSVSNHFDSCTETSHPSIRPCAYWYMINMCIYEYVCVCVCVCVCVSLYLPI